MISATLLALNHTISESTLILIRDANDYVDKTHNEFWAFVKNLLNLIRTDKKYLIELNNILLNENYPNKPNVKNPALYDAFNPIFKKMNVKKLIGVTKFESGRKSIKHFTLQIVDDTWKNFLLFLKEIAELSDEAVEMLSTKSSGSTAAINTFLGKNPYASRYDTNNTPISDFQKKYETYRQLSKNFREFIIEPIYIVKFMTLVEGLLKHIDLYLPLLVDNKNDQSNSIVLNETQLKAQYSELYEIFYKTLTKSNKFQLMIGVYNFVKTEHKNEFTITFESHAKWKHFVESIKEINDKLGLLNLVSAPPIQSLLTEPKADMATSEDGLPFTHASTNTQDNLSQIPPQDGSPENFSPTLFLNLEGENTKEEYVPPSKKSKTTP